MEHFLAQVINGLQLGLVYALIALGYTMVYGIVRLINFAHGDVFMVGAFVGYFSFVAGVPWPVAVLAGMAVCGVLGVVIEKLAYRPLRYAPKISALISAMGVSLFLEFFTQLKFVFGPNYLMVPRVLPAVNWKFAGVTVTNTQALILAVVVVMFGGLQFLIQRTKTGMGMRAVSFDHDAARLMGVNVDGVISMTFLLGSALAGAGGVLFSIAYPEVWTFMGIMPGLKAFTAAVLGGIGNVPGAVVGALIMGQVEVMSAAYLSAPLRDAIAFSVLILVLVIRPTGIFGRTEPEKV